MPALRSTRVPVLGALLALAVLAAGAMAAAGGLRASAAADGDGPAALRDDDAGDALFALGAMAPGETVRRCIRLTAAQGTGQVALATPDVDGELARFLDVEVATGTGGRFGSCDAFAGRRIFRGTLEDLGSHGAALPGERFDDDRRSATYEVAVTLRDVPEAQGRSVRVAFRWDLEADDEPGGQADRPLTATPVPRPGPQADADTRELAPRTPSLAAGAPPRVPGAPASGPRRSRPGGARRPPDAAATPPPLAETTPAGRSTVPRRIARVAQQAARVAAAAARAVATAAAPIARQGSFPALLVLLLGSFLGFQNRLDRADPKLALAPLDTEPLAFPEDPLARLAAT